MNLLGRFLRFGLVGGSGVLVDMGVLYLLHDPKRFALPLLVSKLLSMQVAILNNFAWNELWTFGDRSAQRSTGRDRLLRLLRFELICLAGGALAAFVLAQGVSRFGLHYMVANAIAIGVSTAWNFGVNLRWNWATRPPGGLNEPRKAHP